MTGNFKAKFRAWLIDLVREAIKLEAKQALGLNGVEYTHLKANEKAVAAIKPLPAPKSYADALQQASVPSFEQMQAEAIAEQQKFYEVEK